MAYQNGQLHSDSASLGSNPSPPASKFKHLRRGNAGQIRTDSARTPHINRHSADGTDNGVLAPKIVSALSAAGLPAAALEGVMNQTHVIVPKPIGAQLFAESVAPPPPSEAKK